MQLSMQKIQILFPNPLMGRVKAVATEEDRPVSEVIRRAVERFLETRPEKPRQHLKLPTFRGGIILVPSEQLKDAIYDDEPL
jgi:metal-responsive CopG/Arc/MetJ family transcriptional regulator